MSVLDSFTFLLAADEKKAVDGIKKVGTEFDKTKEKGKKSSEEISDEFEDAGKKVNTTSNKIREALSKAFSGIPSQVTSNFSMASSLTAIAAAAGGAIVAGLSLNAVLQKQESILQRVNDAATLGVDISQYDAMGKAFELNGLDADGFRDSLFDLNEALGEAAADAESGKAKSFKTFGISLKDAAGNVKSADQALLELAGSMEKMTKQEAIFQIKALGITDNKTIDTLLKGRKALESQIALQKEKGVLDQRDADNAKAYKAATQELNSVMGSLTDSLAAMLLPAVTEVTKGFLTFFNFITEHKGFVVGALGAIAGIGVAKLIPMIKEVTLLMKLLKIETLIALWPFTLLAAVIIGLGLIIDDLWNYFTGGESVIGDLAAKFPMLKDAIEGLKVMVLSIGDIFTDPKKAFEDFWNFLKLIWKNMVADAQVGIDYMIDAVVNKFSDMVVKSKAVFQELFDWVINLFKNIGNAISDGVSDAASSAWKSAKSGFGLWGEDESTPQVNVAESAIAASNALSGASSSPIPTSTSGRISNTNNTSMVNVDKVEVITQATDANSISEGIRGGLNDHLQGTATQYDDGRSH